MAMLGGSSAANSMSRMFGNSPTSSAMLSRRQIIGGGNTSAENYREKRVELQIADARRMDNARANRVERTYNRDQMITRRDNRRVISLLEQLVKASGGSRGGGLFGGGGGLLSGLLGGAGIGALASRLFGGNRAKIGGVRMGADGRWRDSRGRFARPSALQRGGQSIRNFGGRVMGALNENRFTRAVINNPAARGAGKLLGGASGKMLRAGGRLVAGVGGKLLLPLAIGMSLVDAAQGMRNADEILGRKVNFKERAMVGVAEAVNGALFGLPSLVTNKLFGKDFTNTVMGGVGDIGGTIKQAVENSIANVKSALGQGIGVISDSIGSAYEAFTNYVNEVKGAGQAVVDAISSGNMIQAAKAVVHLGAVLSKTVTTPVKAVTRAAVTTGAAIGSGAVTVAKGAVEAGQKFGNYVSEKLGMISGKYESRGRVDTISSGKGDRGGASYGKYQLASKTGTLQTYLRESGYASQFAGLTPGSKEFNAKWRELAKNDPNFGASQHEFIKRTHYDVQMRKLAKAGIDLSGRGRAVQEAVWSTSTQYGPSSSIIQKALAGRNLSSMTDAQIVSAIQDYKAANVNKHFAKSDAKVRQGVANRINNEKADLIGLANAPADVKVSPTMKAAKAEPAVTKLTEELPVPKPAAAPSASTPTVSAPSGGGKPAAAQQISNAASSNRGKTAGLPAVDDVADRPRIDVQAIATTIPVR